MRRIRTRLAPSAQLRKGDIGDVELTAREDAVEIRLARQVRFDGAASISGDRKEAVLQSMRQCSQKIREFWQRYGIDFQVSFELASPKRENARFWKKSERRVGLEPEESKNGSDARYFSYFGDRSTKCLRSFDTAGQVDGGPCEQLRQAEFCRMLLHETAHDAGGLEDEYGDRNYFHPDQNAASVMESAIPEWETIEFYHRHIRKTLRQLCDVSGK